MTTSEEARHLLVEFLAERDAGRSPDVETFARRIGDPEGRARFRALLEEVDAIRAVLPEPPSYPARIGRFAIDGELGRGGMGVVYEGRTVQGERVAVKALPDEKARDPAYVDRFRRELDTLAELHHPHVARVLEIGEDDGRLYLAMERLEGGSLEDRVSARRREDRPADEREVLDAVTVAARIARALDAAHRLGVVHRDVKPSNILFAADGQPRLVDFGLAFLEKSSKLTTADHVLGTPAYLAPERLLDPRAADDRRVDVYSLGVTLYEAVTGHRPFPPSFPEAVAAARLGPPDPALFLGRPLDRGLVAVLERALEHRPTQRYPTAAAFAEDLEAWLDGRPVTALRGDSRRRLLRSARRHPRIALSLTLLVLAALGAVAAAAAHRWHDARRAAARLEEAHRELAAFDEVAARLAERIDPPPERADGNDWPRLGLRHRQSARDDVSGVDVDTLRSELAVHFAKAEDALLDALALGDAAASPPLHGLRRRRAAMLELEGREEEARRTWSVAAGLPPLATLRIAPPEAPADVRILRYDRSGGDAWPEVEVRAAFPITQEIELPFDAGSYVLVFRRAGEARDIRVPVVLRSGVTERVPPLRLPTDDEIGDEWEYVPPGAFVAGGDPRAEASEPRTIRRLDGFFMKRLELTMAEWLEFLQDLRARGVTCLAEERAARYADDGWPADLPLHVPRENVHVPPGYDLDDLAAGAVPYFEPDRVVHLISHVDADHYLRWRNERALATGEPWVYALPTGDQWEKAARGADGRAFAWGDVFDWRFCHGGHTRHHVPLDGTRHLVPGRFPTDRSPYGVLDLTGHVREFCQEQDEASLRYLVRGGEESYYEPDQFRLAARRGALPDEFNWDFGVRLVRTPRER